MVWRRCSIDSVAPSVVIFSKTFEIIVGMRRRYQSMAILDFYLWFLDH